MDEPTPSPKDEVLQRIERMQAALNENDAEAALVMAYAVEHLLTRHPEICADNPDMQASFEEIRGIISTLEEKTGHIPPAEEAEPEVVPESPIAAARSKAKVVRPAPRPASPPEKAERPAGKDRGWLAIVGGVLLVIAFLISLPHLLRARQNAQFQDRMNGVVRNASVQGYDVEVHVEGGISDQVLYYDVRSLPAERSNEVCYELLARFALRIRPQSFKKVVLCYKGDPRFEMAGGYFDRLATLEASARANERLALAENVHEPGKEAKPASKDATLQMQEEAFTSLCEHWFSSGRAEASRGKTSDE